MSTTIANQTPYLQTSKEFPEDLHQLSVEVNRAYLDIANAVNDREIAIYPKYHMAITGKAWHIQQNKKQQGLRQTYTFTTTANIPHGLKFSNIDYFSHCYGEYTDGTNWYGIIHGTSVTIAGQLLFYLTPTNIVFVTGGGTMPALTKGIIVLEWISVQ